MTISNSKPFNVTVLHPPGFIHALALKEAADYLHVILRACGYQATRTINHVAEDAFNVICCAHLLKGDLIEKIPRDSIVFNSESLEDTREAQFQGSAYGEILDRFCVWDYSIRNLPLIGHDNKSLIPFLNCAALKRTDIRREAGSTLLFYGRVTPRRKTILDNLQLKGVPVRVLSGDYETQRDVQMLRAWAILNLHKNDDTRAFEPIRCFYPLINEVPVISEDVKDASADSFRESVFFIDTATLIDDIIGLYHNRPSFDERSRVMLAEFKKKDPVPAVAAAVEQFLARTNGV